MGLNQAASGFQKLTASGVIGTSGKAVALFGYTIRSNANGSASVNLYNGTSTSGTLLEENVVQTDDTVQINFCKGKIFPSGLYVSLDSNTSYVTVWYQLI